MSEDSSERTCRYAFDPDEWEAEMGTESELTSEELDDDGVWRCPHEAESSHEYCVFHRSPDEKSESAVRESLFNQIEKPGESPKQFIGARFGALDFSFSTLESTDNHLINLRHAVFEGETMWEDAIVRQPLRLDGATFHERANFNMATFESEFYCSKATFHGRAWFNGTTFSQGGWFYKADFGPNDFSFARFGATADFHEATFGHTNFHEAVFEGRAEFNKATFDFALFPGVRFEDLTYFDKTTLPDRANFRHASFKDIVSFEEVALSESTCYVELFDADVTEGRLHQPAEGTILYDLEDATVGDVVLDDGSSGAVPFAQYRFVNTTFEGFDFGRYRDSLNATAWRLHEFESVPRFEEDGGPSPGELENTYLKAKNGANAIGDTTAAAGFFRWEMLYRRKQYRPQIRGSEGLLGRFTAAFRWTGNVLLDLTSGYGERPSRTVVASLGIILAFSGVFSLVRSAQAYDHPLGSLILSLESFVGVILGGAEPIANPWVRLLASIEGFMGAFFIALFVFTLTRSIHR
jgi:uncharacterized protein YjbI with pentapeptide repeats